MSYLELFVAAMVTGVIGLCSLCVVGMSGSEVIRGMAFFVGICSLSINTCVCWYAQWYIRNNRW